MIGLGVGIDYSLFIVTRHRSRLTQGMEVEEAVARAVATSGSAVAFAGGTVVIALCSLSLAGIPIVSALGYSRRSWSSSRCSRRSRCCPRCSRSSATRINSLAVPFAAQARPTTTGRTAGRAGRAGSAGHPWPALSPRSCILLVLALPVLDMRLGQQDNGQLPKSTTPGRPTTCSARASAPASTGRS